MTTLERQILEMIWDRTEMCSRHPTRIDIEKKLCNVETRHVVFALEGQGLIAPHKIRKPHAHKRYVITEAGKNLMRQVA